MNPNSANQLWARWVFEIHEHGRHVPRQALEINALRWLRMGFGTAGRARLERTRTGWRIVALIEGKPAHDPGFVESVRLQFQRDFVAKGWGPLATSKVSAKVLAGSTQDGRPAAQLVELPLIPIH